ncbi:MAG: hypothetical protein U0Q22_15475 [Acidimicrobiales bacterium]
MSDLDTPLHRSDELGAEGHTDAVIRVLASLSSGTTDGAVGRDTLRHALASEGRSFTDLPEIGLWLALTEISLTADDDVIDLSELPAPPDDAQPVELTAVVEDRAQRLAGFLHTALHDPDLRRSVLAVRRRRSPGTTPDDEFPAEGVEELGRFLHGALDHAWSLPLPDPAAPGTARPDTYWQPATVRRIVALDRFLRSRLGGSWTVALADPTVTHHAPLDPYWPQPVARRAEALDEHLRLNLGGPIVHVPRSRLGTTSHGAVPDPYWPRHLVRDRPPSRPIPRSPIELEHDLATRLAGVGLVGDLDVDDDAAELEIALAALVRAVPLDRLGRIFPATLATYLVRQTALHPDPDEFDERVTVTALRRSNPVGLAFSEALVRLGKPVFREIERRDEFDHRSRYARRMQLHVGLGARPLDELLEQVQRSFWAGAASGREIAQDWLLAKSALSPSLGADRFGLLACTDHGEAMLDAVLDLVRLHHLDDGAAEPHVAAALPPLTAEVCERVRSWLDRTAAPAHEWGEPLRPRIRLGDAHDDGPQVELPRDASRWHLNGELLAYGSPDHRRIAPLPPVRSGRWSITVGTGRRTPLDLGVRSAAPDRTVLVFDEQGRYHHHALPLGGRRATVVAPTGTRVDGAVERSLLLGRWAGHEQIDVDLTSLDRIGITCGRATVDVTVDTAPGARMLPGDRWLVFSGTVPEPATVDLTVETSTTNQHATLADLWVRHELGAYGLDHLLGDGPVDTATITVGRNGVVDLRLVVGTGWAPLPGEAPADGLARLVRPFVLATADGATAAPPVPGPTTPLSTDGWRSGLTLDGASLTGWLARNGRSLRQWRATTPALAHLVPCLTRAERSPHGRLAASVVTAALLARTPGRRQAEAGARFADATALAPALARSAAALADAYAGVLEGAPEVRFATIPLAD